MIGVYPGTFDPCTNGHIDIIQRASYLVDELVIAVANNVSKKYLLEKNERINHLKLCTAKLSNVKVYEFDGFVVNFAKKINANLIIRGIRNDIDFKYEYNMYFHNKKLNNDIETVFLPCTIENMFISSSNVKEIALFGGDITGLVPKEIQKDVLSKYNKWEG
jgi:pantetheine-phosphate adenylyltransferase